MILGPLLQREFQPGTPAFERLQETKGRGRRLTPGGLEDFASRWLLSEADIPSALMKASRMRLGGARAEASAPAEAAAAVAQRSAPPAAAAESRSDVDEYPPPAAAQPRRHAVVIGVERYREQLPKADYAEADARAFAEYAKRVLGVPEENVALLTGERATRGDFEKYFERWLPNHVDKGGQVYVYYSGHGAPDAANGNAYLDPYDGDPT
ncbi:MAG: caspase family protein, partial [Elusimicrobia bacterium]|nr:caspase family protein [Elusimicrobiota bacterium]